MKVWLNNKEVETDSITVSQFLEELMLPRYGIAVALDNKLLPQGQWSETLLYEGMRLVVIKAACGG